MWIIPSVAEAAKIFPLWLKLSEVIAGGSLARGRTAFTRAIFHQSSNVIQWTNFRASIKISRPSMRTIAFHVFIFQTVKDASPNLSILVEPCLHIDVYIQILRFYLAGKRRYDKQLKLTSQINHDQYFLSFYEKLQTCSLAVMDDNQ